MKIPDYMLDYYGGSLGFPFNNSKIKVVQRSNAFYGSEICAIFNTTLIRLNFMNIPDCLGATWPKYSLYPS